MSSFGLSIVALAAMVGPGVIFFVSFFNFSIIKRTTISFGPAVDIAVFFSLSLLINALFGGFIGWVAAAFYDPCGTRMLADLIGTLSLLIHGGREPQVCSTGFWASYFYLYLTILCVASAILGGCAVLLYESLGFSFGSGVFKKITRCARTAGVTTCSALCKFGGENSLIVYVGRVNEITLDDKYNISYLSISNVQRSLLTIGAQVSASAAEDIANIASSDEFVIPGASIENIAFSHLNGRMTRRSYARMLLCTLAICLPILISLVMYFNLANAYAHAHLAGATRVSSSPYQPAHSSKSTASSPATSPQPLPPGAPPSRAASP
jgi:hypothetical protein